MGYIGINLSKMIQIEELYTIHYFEYMKDFVYSGESHDFWEFIYVDKGTIHISMDHTTHTLTNGDIAFHQPNEFHSIKATGENAPNLIVMSFSCNSPAMDFFKRQILQLDAHDRALLADIIIEARKVFSCPLNDPGTQHMTKRRSIPEGSEQLIQLNLELFLLRLYRKHTTTLPSSALSAVRDSANVFNHIANYMEKNIALHLTLDQICKDNMISRSQLQKVFQKECGQGVIEYFTAKKIQAAKQMIRNDKFNFSQIAEQLGYSSIHYFSRQFKKITDMSPSEYASSVKAITEDFVF